MTLTKADIVQKIADDCGFSKGESSEIVVNRFENHKIVTTVLVVVILALILEVLLRLTNFSILEFTYNYRKAYRYHPMWRVDLAPNAQAWLHLPTPSGIQAFNFIITTNEDAIRVPDRPLDNSPGLIEQGSKIIHCLGDSFAMGWCVSYAESYPSILDLVLHCEYRSLNLGCNGYGTIAGTQKSIHLWDKYPANYSVLLFYSNDYDDDERATRYSQRPVFFHKLLGCWNWLVHHTYTANLPYAIYYSRYWSALLATSQHDVVRGKPCLYETPDFELLDVKSSPSRPDRGRLSKTALLKYRSFLSEQNVPFIVIGLDVGLCDESKDMIRFCSENDIEAYLLKVPEALRLRNEGHLNHIGNYKLAQFVASWIKTRK